MKKLKREKYLEIIKAKEASMLIHIAEMDELRKENKRLTQQVKNLTMHFVSNNEVAVCRCKHIDIVLYGTKCKQCGGIICEQQTDC